MYNIIRISPNFYFFLTKYDFFFIFLAVKNSYLIYILLKNSIFLSNFYNIVHIDA